MKNTNQTSFEFMNDDVIPFEPIKNDDVQETELNKIKKIDQVERLKKDPYLLNAIEINLQEYNEKYLENNKTAISMGFVGLVIVKMNENRRIKKESELIITDSDTYYALFKAIIEILKDEKKKYTELLNDKVFVKLENHAESLYRNTTFYNGVKRNNFKTEKSEKNKYSNYKERKDIFG